MGRMKEFCIDLINANGGIPEGMTIADVARMKELEMYNWEEYERYQERTKLQQYKPEDPGEIGKIEQANGIFQEYYNEAKRDKEERSKQ
jgi:hypothetical protein